MTIWAVLRLHFDDIGWVVRSSISTAVICEESLVNIDRGRISLRCWDMNDNAAIWWVIKGPVLASIMVSSSRLQGSMALQMVLFNK